jgi:hypothetical protein
MLLYNTNGTVSDIQINAIIDGIVTSSLVTAPTIQQAFEASASNAAYQTANPTNKNRNTGSLYIKSGDTSKSDLRFARTKTNTTDKAAFATKYPTSADLHTRGMRKVATIPANTSLSQIVEDRLVLNVATPSLKDGSQSPTFETITADKFTTTYSNGSVLVVGDDTIVTDVNLQNGLGVIGQQVATKGWVKFGNSGPLVGFNNTDNFPAAGDGIYSVTGSMLIKTNKLYFFNGGASNNGWSQII